VKFAPEYVACVLNEHFNDARELFLTPLLAIHRAHLVMLVDRGIVPAGDARAIRAAIDAIAPSDVRRAVFDGSCEDLFFYVDGLIAAGCGADISGRLHTARSRNDIDMTMYRMRQRELVLDLLDGVHALRAALIDLAAGHRDTILAAHTHTQRAQPTTVAHYLLAVIEQLERDSQRLRAAYATTNRSPLGACAITGTGFPIDRDLTSDLLGFDAPTGNTYGSIATVDYLLESSSAAAVLLAGLGRVVQDLLLWSTAEFGYVRFGDGFVQTSSIMPQKRNPVAIEHARAIASKALGEAAAIVQTVHNTPFGDIVDTEDDLQPLVFSMFRDATRGVRLLAAVLPTAEFDAAELEARAGDGWTTLTELADTLTRAHGVPFRTAHAIAARVSRETDGRAMEQVAAALEAASRELTGRAIVYPPDELAGILSPRHFVTVRTTPGGPAPERTAQAVESARALLGNDIGWSNARREALGAAAARLGERVQRI
jgi:argininosuccinate lyase